MQTNVHIMKTFNLSEAYITI